MKTAGLDIATHTGMALVGEGEDRGKVLAIPMKRGFERLQLVAANAEQTLSVWKPDFVVVEWYAHPGGPAAHKNLDSLITLVEIGTAIRAVLHRMGIEWVDVAVPSLKKWTTGKGNAKKEDMAEAVQQRWGFTSSSHDVIDAYALAQMGQMGLEEMLKVPGVFLGRH